MSSKSNNQQPQTPQSTLEWIASNRLYEEYLFFYVIILSAITAVGYYTFGFEIDGWTQPQNLAVNFAFFGVLVVLLFLTPTWYNVVWGSQARLDKRSKAVLEQIETIEEVTLRQNTRELYENNGEFPPNRKQVVALIVLFCLFNFELFFMGAWIKFTPNGEDLYLVWQPDWITNIITWVRSELNTPPLYDGEGLFLFSIEGEDVLASFGNEERLLAFRYADAGLFFHFIKCVFFFIYLGACCILLWKLMDWVGLRKIDPRYINSMWQFTYIGTISLILLPLLTLMATVGLLKDATTYFPMIFNKLIWLKSLGYMIAYLLMAIHIKTLVGWFYFWKNILANLYRKIFT